MLCSDFNSHYMDILVTQADFLNQLPPDSGVYRFYTIADAINPDGKLLYVGKAKNLAKRVQSYFTLHNHAPRITLMVKQIYKIVLTITPDEISALVLESNFIKTLKPKYNIIFNDDKTYPFIRLTAHEFPKLDMFRGTPNQTDMYFGPYTNTLMVKQHLNLLTKLFQLRTCSDQDFNTRVRPCILFSIKRCAAPCVKLTSNIQYRTQIDLATNFLLGKYGNVIKHLTDAMQLCSDNMQFEEAAKIRNQIHQIQQMSNKQIVNNHKQPLSADIIVWHHDNTKTIIYLTLLRHGNYVGDKHFVVNNYSFSLTQVLLSFLHSYYTRQQLVQEVFIDYAIDEIEQTLLFQAFNLKLHTRVIPALQHIYSMGTVNLHKIVEQLHAPQKFNQAIERLRTLLDLPVIERIECLDISHHHGSNTVGGLVVYANAIIDHSQYRKYNLTQDKDGDPLRGNDLLAMETVYKRRLSHNDIPNLPNIIVVDGGELQLTHIKNILVELQLYGKIRVLAICKGSNRNPVLDKLLFDDGRCILYHDEIDVVQFIQALRDEAHRFAITGHRKQQIKKLVQPRLQDIANIGVKKCQALLAYFGSYKNVAQASIAELEQANGIGKTLATKIYQHFH